MDTIFRGDLGSPGGRRRAWIDSLFVDHAIFRVVWTNAAEVMPGRLYRANHPTPGRLAAMARRWRLCTVINLRGQAANGSDALSREAASRLGLAVIDAALASRLPQRARVLALCAVFRTMREPALVHCKSGADRAGFAAAVFILLNGGSSRVARAQLSLRFGHFRGSRAGILDAFIARYAHEAEGRKPFLAWLAEDYDEAALQRDFAPGRFSAFLNDWLLRRE